MVGLAWPAPAAVGSTQVGKEINGSASCDREISWQKCDNVRGQKGLSLAAAGRRMRKRMEEKEKITISTLQRGYFAVPDKRSRKGDSAIKKDDVFVEHQKGQLTSISHTFTYSISRGERNNASLPI